MSDRAKDISRGLLKYSPESNDGAFTNVPQRKWRKPNFQPLPDNSGKDRFGNHMHYSPDLAYLDRSNEVARAGLLLSPDGQSLVRDLPGCLIQLDRAIKQISEDKHSKVEFKHGSLSTSDTLRGGAQSKIYLWERPSGEKYIIKVPRVAPRDVPPTTRLDQPYLDEMLQTQEIAESLRPLSDKKKVRLSTFLFASSSVSCTKFVEGRHPIVWIGDQHERFIAFAKGVRRYISNKRHSDDGLFLMVKVDLGGDEDEASPNNNIIIGADGVMTWIDPFVT